MKTKNILLLISIITFGLLISCNNDDEKEKVDKCTFNAIGYITSVDSPNSGMVNEKINIKVNFRVASGCGGFGKFIETENNNIKNIEVEAKYEGCICTSDTPIKTVNYVFIPSSVGNYELNFKSSRKEFITVNLKIN